MSKKKLSVRELLIKFEKATREARTTEKGVMPIHVPYTKFKGHDFLALVAAYYGLNSRKDAIAKIDGEVAKRKIFRARVKGGYALFLEEQAQQARKAEAKDILAEIL